MGIFVRINSSLDKNKYLTKEVKESILNILKDLGNLLETIDIDYLCEQIETLDLKASDDRVDKTTVKYDPFTNSLKINQKELETGNAKYLLASGLVDAIAIDINKKDIFKALSAGVNDSIARQIAPGEDIPDFTVASIYAGLLTSLVGTVPIFDSVVKTPSLTQTNPLIEALAVKEGIDVEKFWKTNNGINYFHTLSINRPEAEVDLGTITNNIIDLCVTPEQLERMKECGYIFTNFDGRYTGLDKVKPFLEMKELALKQIDPSKNR